MMRMGRLHGSWIVPFLALAGAAAAADVGSPLAEAVKNRDNAAVLAQLKRRANVNAPLPDGTTALHWAVHWNDLETLNLLVRAGADLNATNRYGATPLWMACSDGDTAIVEALLKGGANPNLAALEGESPLMAAARAGSVEITGVLLAHGADVTAKDSWKGQTALMRAVGDFEPHADIARVLIENHSDVNAKSKGGFTPLLFAVRQGDLESTRLLVEAGANVNEKAPDGSNVLLVGINSGYFRIAEYLLERGASSSMPDRQGFTPLHQAVRRRASSGSQDALAFMKTLVARGADINARTPLVPVKWPVDREASPRPKIDEIEFAGATPFWIAANAADTEALTLLKSLGADPTITTIEHTTPLMVAAGLGYGTRGPTARLGGRIGDSNAADVREGNKSNARALAAVKLLVDMGQDINAVNDNGQTPLHGSASAAIPDVTKYLIERGARLEAKDTLGRTPLVVANDNRTDKYRANQNLLPEHIESTWAVLRPLYGDQDQK
jgi:ankyrin repeat protein